MERKTTPSHRRELDKPAREYVAPRLTSFGSLRADVRGAGSTSFVDDGPQCTPNAGTFTNKPGCT